MAILSGKKEPILANVESPRAGKAFNRGKAVGVKKAKKIEGGIAEV